MPDEQSPTPRPRFAVPILQPHAGSDEIGQRTLAEVAAALDGLPAGPVDLDVWLESPGGSADAAYRIALLLSQRAETLRFVVLNSARGAATLLTLCADELYMTDAAELGPLDAQLRAPREVTSVRDAARNVDFIAEQAVALGCSAGRQYRQDLMAPAAEALEAGSRLAAALVEGLVRSVEPAAVLDAQNRLRTIERYARRLLRARALRRGEPVPVARRQDVVETAGRLVHAYPTPDFVIDRVEAEQLRLPVRAPADYPDVAAARQALADALSGRRPVEPVPLDPIPEPAGHPHPGPVRTQHAPHSPAGRRPRRRLAMPVGHAVPDDGTGSAPGSGSDGAPGTATDPVGAPTPTGPIDLDDAWIWSLEPQLVTRRGRHADVEQRPAPLPPSQRARRRAAELQFSGPRTEQLSVISLPE